ncbi:MAG TPA: FAD-dependent monooxygenase [Jatrophihabitans sp.]|nr:FAD-dependent monooxygenase [Jatrophihabitans sp.]
METYAADVLISGAGPTGLMLAGELRLAGVSTIVLERRAEPVQQSRALGFSARAIEEFDQRGLLPRFGELETIPIGHFGGLPIDFGVIEGGSYGARGIPQSRTEAILAEWATGLGAELRRQHELIGLTTDELGVTAEVRTPHGTRRLRARYLVGCDGSRSTVRELSGIEFLGTDAVIEMWLADVRGVKLRPRFSGERVPGGMVMVLPAGPDVFRVGVYERTTGPRHSDQPPSFAEVADAFERLTGEDIHHAEPLWVSWFTDSSKQAGSYRNDRVFLAGDAVHVHLPIGAQGMSGGIGDAVNLGWKLAAAIHGHAAPRLLDSYHAERQPVGARVITNTLAQRILYLSGEEIEPVRELFTELLEFPAVQRHLAGMVTGQDIRYDYGYSAGQEDPHPLLGRRLRNQEFIIPGTSKGSLYQLLQSGRMVLLNLAWDKNIQDAAEPWQQLVDVVKPTVPGPCVLAGVDAVLVRPDGYVAWVSSRGGGPVGLTEALAHWYAEPAENSQPALAQQAS